jgi:hypothetical protein
MNELTKVSKPNEGIGSTESFNHTQRVAKALSQSDLVPKEYKNNIPNTIIALEIAARIGASPMAVMQNLHIIHGKPSWSSTFIIGAINSSKRFEPLRFDVKGSGMELSCIAWTTERGKTERIEGPAVTMQMAKLEGWIDKAGSKWKTMPELMIRYRAAAFFGRLYTPDIMLGMQTREEVIDVTHQEVNQDEVRRLKEYERVSMMIQDATTIEELESIVEFVAEDQMNAWKTKMEEINGKV